MLTAVKNQWRVCLLSLKYNMMRQMLNKVTFLSNIAFMMINNAAFIVQWVILFRLEKQIGGYTFQEVMLLWGLSASSYGLSKIVCARAFALPELIIGGETGCVSGDPEKCAAECDYIGNKYVGNWRSAVWNRGFLRCLFSNRPAVSVFAVYDYRSSHYYVVCFTDGKSDLLVCACECIWRSYDNGDD